LVLLFLFVRGISNLQSVRNLAYMVFFIVYTAYVEVYRKTSKVLVLFISLIIFDQYVFSLFWDLSINSPEKMHFYRWMDFYPQNNPKDDPWLIKGNHNMYWRVDPNIGDWIVLFFMALLDSINKMFKNKKEIILLQEFVASDFKDKYSKFSYYYKRTEKILQGFVVYSVLGINIYIHKYLQVNLINWVFWILNILNFGLMIRGTKTTKYVNQIKATTNSLKFYSLMILVIDIAFSIFIGEREKTFPNSLDQKFKRALPRIYAHLDIIGLRPDPTKMLNPDGTPISVEKQMETRFMIYITFFMLSMYLSSHFKTIMSVMKADKLFGEDDFKKLFNYQMTKPENDADNYEFKTDADDELDGAVFRKKKVYYFQDLIDYYEKQRFTLPFMVYRAIDWWPLVDMFATYGHVISNGIIVLVATQCSVNFFSTFNILCVCLFYSMISSRLHVKAVDNLKRSGLQSQCDVMMAKLITKRYKNESFYEIINLRL